MICLECKESFNDKGLFNKHLRSHKLTIEKYYLKNYPRFDLYDKSLIKFKNEEQYLSSDFNSKANMVGWFSAAPKEAIEVYLKKYLVDRKSRKNLTYAPSQCELRSLPIPGIVYYDKIFGNYNNLCRSLEFKIKYPNEELLPKNNISKLKIIIDNREQQELKFNIGTKFDTLSFGDYKLDSNISDCYIERKSLADFYGTLSSGFDRFTREIERAKEAGAYLVVVIESSFESVYTFRETKRVKGKVFISPEFIFHNMRDLIQKFDNLQFLFVNNRREASRIIEKIFASGSDYKYVDLQKLFDKGWL